MNISDHDTAKEQASSFRAPTVIAHCPRCSFPKAKAYLMRAQRVSRLLHGKYTEYEGKKLSWAPKKCQKYT